MIRLTLFLSMIVLVNAYALPVGADKVINTLILENDAFADFLENNPVIARQVQIIRYQDLCTRPLETLEAAHQ